MDVKIVRLVTGDEVVTEVVIESGEGDSIRLKNPIRPVQAGDGKIGFMPWCQLTSDTEFVIMKDLVVFTADASPEIANIYNERFGGIVTVTKPTTIIT